MATATKKTIQKVVQTTVDENVVELTLTMQEAKILTSILAACITNTPEPGAIFIQLDNIIQYRDRPGFETFRLILRQ
jgi:hypothetical protein